MKAAAGMLLVAMSATLAQAGECRVTMAQYGALDDGVAYDRAVEILGCPGQELSRSSLGGIVTVMVQWMGESPGANMNAMFQDGRMVMKAQLGLK